MDELSLAKQRDRIKEYLPSLIEEELDVMEEELSHYTDSIPPTGGPYGRLNEYSVFLRQEEIDELQAEGKFLDYLDAMRELDKEFPILQTAANDGEVEFLYLKWINFK